MPTMPYMLPRRAVSCDDSPRSARMNSTAATRYATTTRMRATGSGGYCTLLPEHCEHASRDEEAARDVDRCECSRRDRDRRRAMEVAGAAEQAADDDDAADRV